MDSPWRECHLAFLQEVPAALTAGQGLRNASVLLSAARFVGRNENPQLLALLVSSRR